MVEIQNGKYSISKNREIGMESRFRRRMFISIISLLSVVCLFSIAWAVDYQILFKPNGSGVSYCYEFTVAEVGGPLLREVNVLSQEGMRQNWGIDTVGGRGPWDNGVWKNRQFALRRVNQLAPVGDDWYGCQTHRPLIGQPVFSMGWPNKPIQFPVQKLWQILFKPNNMGRNCFEFNLALVGEHRVASPGILTPLARRENWGIDANGGFGSGPEGIWYDYGAASSRMNQLSSYGGDAYGCRGNAQWMPPAFSVGWPPPQDSSSSPSGIQLWQILRKPNGMGPNCFEFYLTNVGGSRVASPGVLTLIAAREGWIIDDDLGAGSGPMGTWVESEAATSRMNQLSTYGGDLYGCRNPNRPIFIDPTPTPPSGDRILHGSLDPRAKAELIAKQKGVALQFESSQITVMVYADGSSELQGNLRCTITVTGTRKSSGISWSRYTYTVTLTPNGRVRGAVKAFRQVDYVWDYVERGKQGQRNHVGKPIPVEGRLTQQGDVWHLNMPNGNGSSIGSVPYLLE